MSVARQAERQASDLEASSESQQQRWKNPNDVVRIRRKLSRKPSLKSSHRPADERRRATPVLKRSSENPAISATPPKRSRGGIQDISNSPIAQRTPEKTTKLQERLQDQVPLSTDAQIHTPTAPPPSDTAHLSQALPLDWALKTKVRFVSPFPFSWAQALKPHQEACGLTNFLSGAKTSCDQHVDLQEGLMVWVHPSLPFLKTFPRSSSGGGDVRQKNPLPPALLQDKQVLQSLRDDWSTSLCSVYQLLKCGHCPYFYLCANQFTVLFAAAGVRGNPSISAVITPTTSGMRDALRKEGAELNLPLAPRGGVGVGDEESSDAEEDGGNWLATMGLPAQDLPLLRPQRASLPQELKIDNRPQSAVLVEGPGSVHVLFNFLLASKTTIATTGSLAGVPPTILSPLGFSGATLRSLKVRQGSVRELSEGEMVQRFYLELTGPVLPMNLHKLCRLFLKTQHGQFTAHFTNVDSTGAFNGGSCSSRDSERLLDSYLHRPPLGTKHGLKELVCENHSITWE